MPETLATPFPIDKIRLEGGRPCLDFVNTIHDRFAAVPIDYLGTPQQYLEWCLRAGLLGRQEAAGMAAAAGVMGEARSFREHLHAVLSARIDGIAVPANSLRECDRWLHQAWADLSMDPASPDGVSWSAAAFDARLPLKRIALSALDVLRTAEPHRFETLRVAGLLRMAVLRRQQGRPTPMVRHGGLRHPREDAPLPPERVGGSGSSPLDFGLI